MAVLDISKTYLSLIRECQYCLVAHNLDYINSTWKSVKRIISGLSEMMNTVSTTCDEETILSMVKELSPILTEMGDAQCNRDVCRIADLIEGDILPWLSEKLNDTTFLDGYDYFDRNIEALNKAGFTDLAELLTEYGHSDHEEHINCSVNSYGEVVLEYTDETHSCNLTGQLHPFMDAAYFVYDMRESKTISYALAGGCMIYEAIAFMIINIATKVFVLEEDTELLFKIFKYFDLAESILSGRLIFLHKDLLGEVAGFIAKRELLVKSTSLKGKLDKTLKKAYSTYQMIVVSAKEEEYLLFRNFHENIRLKALNVSEITGSFKEKNIFLIAGGPSLGNSIEVLRKRHPESVIICVGTSAKKLLAENIDPDYVIISDPLPAMEKQLNQPFDYDATSLIFLATTYSEAVQNFAGKRYIVFQKDFRLSEETAAEENMPLFETGGSVTTLALDIALNSEASHIYCMGCDMAYTYNQMHVSGVDDKDGIVVDSENRRVKGVKGDTLETAQNLDSYRKWIENRIKNYKGTAVITNISDGAYIEGMENISCDAAANLY